MVLNFFHIFRFISSQFFYFLPFPHLYSFPSSFILLHSLFFLLFLICLIFLFCYTYILTFSMFLFAPLSLFISTCLFVRFIIIFLCFLPCFILFTFILLTVKLCPFRNDFVSLYAYFFFFSITGFLPLFFFHSLTE